MPPRAIVIGRGTSEAELRQGNGRGHTKSRTAQHGPQRMSGAEDWQRPRAYRREASAYAQDVGVRGGTSKAKLQHTMCCICCAPPARPDSDAHPAYVEGEMRSLWSR